MKEGYLRKRKPRDDKISRNTFRTLYFLTIQNLKFNVFFPVLTFIAMFLMTKPKHRPQWGKINELYGTITLIAN